MKPAWKLLTASVALLALAACSDTLGNGDQLATEDVNAVTDEMVNMALDGVDAGVGQAFASAPGPQGAPAVEWTRTFTETRSCPAGGTMTLSGTVSGNVDRATRSGSITVSHTLALDDCARTRGDVTVTVNTDPPITFAGTVTIDAGQRSGEFTKTGTFLWETSDGRSGSCEINLKIVRNADGTGSVTGTACGREVNRTFTRGRNG